MLKQICRSPVSSLRKHISSSRKNSAKRRLTETFNNSPLTLIEKNMFTGQPLNTTNPEQVAVSLPQSTHETKAILETNSKRTESYSLAATAKTLTDTNIQENSAHQCTKNTYPSQSQKNTERTLQNKQKNIIILGGNQCVGLSSKLITSRRDNKYEKYNVSAFIQPEAGTKQILEPMKQYNLSVEDRVILSVGEHDENPLSIMTDLCFILN